MYVELKRKNLHKTITYTPRTWHRRSVVNVGGSMMVGIPARLIQWDRRRHLDPQRWSPGDAVEVAYLDIQDRDDNDTYILIRYRHEDNATRGAVSVGEELHRDQFGNVQVVKHPATVLKEQVAAEKKRLILTLKSQKQVRGKKIKK